MSTVFFITDGSGGGGDNAELACSVKECCHWPTLSTCRALGENFGRSAP
jgi:hypothetical protein